MKKDALNLEKGEWLVVDCGKHPSEKQCKLVFMAPVAQREELLNAAVEHAVKVHQHKAGDELKKTLSESCETIHID